jgi:hypothetical protein
MLSLDARNKMSHVYNSKEFEKVIEQIQQHYLSIFDELHFLTLQEINNI